MSVSTDVHAALIYIKDKKFELRLRDSLYSSSDVIKILDEISIILNRNNPSNPSNHNNEANFQFVK